MLKLDEPSSAKRTSNHLIASNSVLIVGAGPAGLAIAKCLQDKDVPSRIVDRYGVAGGAYSRMYAGLTLASPSAFLDLPETSLEPSGEYVLASEFAEYLEGYAVLHGIEIEKAELTGMIAGPADVKTAFANGQEHSYPLVVIATGMTDSPTLPAIEGLPIGSTNPLVLHSQDWQGPPCLDDGPILIVGGGMRGIELAEECARAGLRPMISARTPKIATWPLNFLGRDIRYFGYPFLRKLPVRFFRGHCSARWRHRPVDRGFKTFLAEKKITIVPEVRRVRGREVSFVDGTSMKLGTVVLATGYRFEMPFLPPFVPRSEQGFPIVRRGVYDALPNVYFIGLPCALRLDSHFIHGIAADARILAGDIAAKLATPGVI